MFKMILLIPLAIALCACAPNSSPSISSSDSKVIDNVSLAPEVSTPLAPITTTADETSMPPVDVIAIKNAVAQEAAQWTPVEPLISPDEFSSRANLNFDHMKETTLPRLSDLKKAGKAVEKVATLPAFTWQNIDGSNYITPIKNQGACGSCWAMSSAAALESLMMINGAAGSSLDLSEEILLSCSGAGSCNGGYIDKAADFLKNTGLPAETYSVYTATQGSCVTPSAWLGSTSQINNSVLISSTYPAKAADIKNALVSYGPLVASMIVFSDFYSYGSGVYSYTTGYPVGGHAVTIIGYVDDAAYKGGGYFAVKNSWGTSFGEQGFFRIAYSELSSSTQFARYTIAYNYGQTITPVAPVTWAVSQTSLSMPSNGGTSTITVTPSKPFPAGWHTYADSAWITLTTGSYTGTKDITVTVSPTDTTSTSKGTVYVVNDIGIPVVTIPVTRTGGAFTVSPMATLTAANSSGSIPATTMANFKWIASSNVSWLKIDGTTNTGSASINYNVDLNTGGIRTGFIFVKSLSGMTAVMIIVTQYQISATASVASLLIPRNGATGTIALTPTAPVKWTATTTMQNLVLTNTTATDTGSFNYSLPANSIPSLVSGTIVITANGTAIKTISVGQLSGSFSLTPASITFAKMGGTATSNFSSSNTSISWIATSDSSWMTVTPSGVGATAIKITATPTTTARTGKITITNSNNVTLTTITIKQTN